VDVGGCEECGGGVEEVVWVRGYVAIVAGF
jgi:hypothetical protein